MARLLEPAPKDLELSNQVAQTLQHHPRLQPFASLLAHSGDSPFWVAALGSLLLLPVTPHWKYDALVGLAGILLTAIVVQSIKWSVRRPRPAGNWGNAYRRVDPHSFPSGHAARAFFLAIAAFCCLPGWGATLLLVWAILVSLARVALRVHYLSDIALGAVCGLICALALAYYVGF